METLPPPSIRKPPLRPTPAAPGATTHPQSRPRDWLSADPPQLGLSPQGGLGGAGQAALANPRWVGGAARVNPWRSAAQGRRKLTLL